MRVIPAALSRMFQGNNATPSPEGGTGDEETAIDNPFPQGGSRRERRRSNQVNKLTASDFNGKSIRDLVTYFKNKYDSNGDGIFQEEEVEDMLLDTIEICESRAGLEVEKDIMLNKLRKMNRRMKITGATGVVAIIASVLGTYFGSESTFSQGTVEVKDSIIKSKTTSVGLDNNGHGHLQDAKSGLDISTRGFGDTFYTQAKVDPSSRRKLICMTIEEIAALFHDTMSRTEASVVIVGEDGYEKQVVPIDGQFVDNGRTLHFGRGEDSVTLIMDSDVCNTAILPAELDVQVTFEEEEEVAEAEEDSSVDSSKDGIFKRARNLVSHYVGVPSQDAVSAQVEVVDMATSLSSTDKDRNSRHLSTPSQVLARHRAEFEIVKQSPRGERKMQTTSSVEMCSGDGCEPSFPVLTAQGYGSVIENGACVSEGDRLPYHNIVNNNPTEGSEGIEMDCANYCSSYSNVDGYVGFSLRFSGTTSLENYPIGRCQCQFKQGTVRPEDTSGSTSVWWGSQASGHVDLAMGNGNNNYVCYPWSDALPLCTRYSDGSAGNLEFDTSTGQLTLNGSPIDSSIGNGDTLGTAYDAVTTINNVDELIIPAGATVYAVGTVEIYSRRAVIDGTLDGIGGGYAGAVAVATDDGEFALPGESPSGTNGHGKGGMNDSPSMGGGGGSHAGSGGRGGEEPYSSNIPFCSDLSPPTCPGYDSFSPYTGCCNTGGKPGDKYDDTLPLTLRPGSGGGGGAGSSSTNGGAGGAGGAAIIFYSEEIVLNGNIYANGINGGMGTNEAHSLGGGGGGSGGAVSFSACTLNAGSSAKIEAKGGTGGRSRNDGFGGGGGSGGVFAYEATTVNYDDSMNIDVGGGARGDGSRPDNPSYRAGIAGNVGKVFLIDNLELEDSCDLPSNLDPSTPLDKDARCLSGYCRTADNKCVCDEDTDCGSSEVCHTDNKCYSSGLSIDDDCSADDGGAIHARCSSGKCRSSDIKCGCDDTDHCPSDKVCKASNNRCVTQKYRLSATCEFPAFSGEGTDSQVSLNVKRNGWTVVDGWIPYMDKDVYQTGTRETIKCPDHTFEVAGQTVPDEYEIKNHGNDELGVSSFTLYDVTNGGEIISWSAQDYGAVGWCLSSKSYGNYECWDNVPGANYPNQGVILKFDGSQERIRFNGGDRCTKDGACSSLECNRGGGSCTYPTKCCAPG